MPKLKVEDLERIREAGRASVCLRQGIGKVKVTVHMDSCGIAAGARKIIKTLLEELEKRGLGEVIVTISGCGGHCDREPMATVQLADQDSVIYADLDPAKIQRIVDEHILAGNSVRDYFLSPHHGPTSQT